jgi:putative transposase
MITRRCSERRFFMRPDAETTNAFVYCLGVAAQRTSVKVMFFLAMSNHYHAGVIDTDGRLPEFLEYFHKLFAKHQNALRGRWENFWAPEQTSAVELVDANDVLAKLIYTLGNPVKDHLVQASHHWPGASSLAGHLRGERFTARRPSHLFRPDGPMPTTVTLELARPPGLEELPQDKLAAVIRDLLTVAEQSAADERARTGVRVLGRKGVLGQRWFDRPRSSEPRRELSPRVACRNVWRRVEALGRNRAFVAAYWAARELFLAGVRVVVFPAGTYWLRRFAGASCEAAGTA